jgi:AcrR family transcriptional regulator
MQISTKKDDALPANTGRTRGRPKTYDRETALKAMRDAFWNKGFAATSLDDLCTATHMNRPSLYNAFGDKTQIFRAVLEHYIEYLRVRYKAAFDAKLPLIKGLYHVYETALRVYIDDHDKPLGCLMMNVALTDTVIDPSLAAIINKAMLDLQMGFRRRLLRAQDAGELAHDANIDALTVLTSSMHSALSVRVRAGESYEVLCQYVRNGMALIPATRKTA